MKKVFLFLTMLLFAFTGTMKAQSLTVCDGTATNGYVPCYGFYADAYLKCEMVYPADSLSDMAGGTINSITYYASVPAPEAWTGTWQVFVSEVADATISAFAGPGTVVYEGLLDATQETMTIDFNAPYQYNGGNLLVGVYLIGQGNYKSVTWVGESLNGSSISGYNYGDLNNISPTGRNFLPKTTFAYEAAGGGGGEVVEVTIGNPTATTGNSYLPTYSLYEYSLTQQIYTADEIGVGGTINSLTMWLQNTSSYARNLNFYLKEVDFATFENGTSWVSMTTADMVGAITLNNGISSFTETLITLAKPFEYSGEGNLVLCIQDVTGEWSSGAYANGMTAAGNQAIYAYRDGTVYNPETPGVTGTLLTTKNVLRLSITTGGGGATTAFTTTPDVLDLGYRPNGAWMAPYVFTMKSNVGAVTVNALDFSGNYFTYEAELPATVSATSPLEVALTTGTAEEGLVESTMTIMYGVDRDIEQQPVTAIAYNPVDGDVTETAINVTSFPYAGTAPTGIYKNYDLPVETEGADAMYKVTFDNDVLLTAGTTGADGVAAIYPEDFNGEGGPMADNNYVYNGPQVNPGPVSMWFNYDYTGTNTWYGTSAAGGTTMWGYKITPAMLQELGLGECSIVTVESAARNSTVATYYDLVVLKGGDTPDLDNIVYYQEFTDFIPGYYFDLDLDEPQALGDDENIWIMFISDSEYAAYCGRYPVDTDNGKIWYSLDLSNWYSNTSYTPEIYTRFVELPTGREVTVDLGSMKIRESKPATGKIAEVEGSAMGASRVQMTQNHTNRDVIGNNIADMYVPAGTYYLAVASTDDEFPVSIEVAEVPVPEQAYIYSPMDGQTNVNAPYLAEWVLGDYTTEMQVLVGTQYPPQTALIDWTDYLVESAFLMDLEPNQSYFMQVNERNAAGTTYGEIIAFTTPIDPVEGLVIAESQLYPGDAAVLTWDAATRSHKGYNVYMYDGVEITKVNETLITETTYAVEGLEYNMDPGYQFVVTAVYDAGESDYSDYVTAQMTGNGTVSGYVYDTDVDHPVAFATVGFLGLDEYWQETYTEFTTDEEGFFTGELLAGLYAAGVMSEGYATEAGAQVVAVEYGQSVEDLVFITHEFYYPLGQITATEEADDVLVEWSWDPAELMIDFETGDFSQAEFTLPAQYPWAITTTNPYEGTYCMKSTCEGVASGTSSIEVTVDVPYDGLMGFWVKVSSEQNYDKFHFYIDGTEMGSGLSGQAEYAYKEYAVTEGTHTYKFEYAKDSSVNSNDDCIYVDNITLYKQAGPAPSGNFYNFDDNSMMSWTSLDADGDGNGWVSSANPGIYHNSGVSLSGTGHNESEAYVISGSYANQTAQALTPDNYLVSPMKIAAQDGAAINFWACAQDASYAAEHFGVAVSTGSNTAAADFTTIQEWTMTAKGNRGAEEYSAVRGTRQGSWYEYNVDLSAYAGQEIWVAIRHFNCSDMFILNVDDITLGDGSEVMAPRGNRELVSYNLYRRNNMDAASVAEPELIAEGINTDVFEYVDNAWSTLSYGEWQWGIQATYDGYAPVPERNREVFTYTFDSGLEGWTNIDADGDGEVWFNSSQSQTYSCYDYSTYGHNGTGCFMISQSYTDCTYDAYNANNFLVSPQKYPIDANSSITFWQDWANDSYPDYYEVMVSTAANPTASDFTAVWSIGSKNHGNGAKIRNINNRFENWTEYNVSLAAYAGQEVWIAFRHQDYDNYELWLDDVTITAGGSQPVPPTPVPSGDGLSEILWSNVIDKDMEATVDFNIALNNGQSPEGIVMNLTGVDFEESYTFDATGMMTVELRKGEYALAIEPDGYAPIYEVLTINDDTEEFSYMLEELVAPVEGFYVSPTGWAMWEGTGGVTPPTPPTPGSDVTYGFENDEEGWTSIDADGDGNEWYNLNPSNNPNNIPGHNNSVGHMTSASYNGSALNPNNYLVSPEKAAYSQISFWACGQDASWAAEHFGVAVSTTGNTSAADFTTIQEWTLTAKGSGVASVGRNGQTRDQGAWYEFTVDLSSYAGQDIWVAIRHFNCSDMFRLNVDDITLTSDASKGDRAPISYKMMLDGEYLGETYNPFYQFDVEGMEEGEVHVGAVAPLYASGMGDWMYYTWTYTSCSHFAGMVDFSGEVLPENTVKLNWTLPGAPVPPGPGGNSFTEDFENGLNWNVLTILADGGSWIHSDDNLGGYDYTTLAHSGTGFAMCYSFVDYVGSFNTDSYMYTTEKYNISNGSTLSFWADNANDSYPENFSVVISTVDNPTSAADFTQVWSGGAKGTGSNGAAVRRSDNRYENWRSHSIDLSAYAGQTVYIGFHDVNYDMYEIWIDDVELTAGKGVVDNRNMWDLLGTFNAAEGGHYGVVTDGEYIYTSNWGYSAAAHNFYKYDMEGNVIEGFEVAGCGNLRGMTFDGEYVYGVANSSTIYCVDLNNHTLVGTTTSAYGAMRGITYDPARDGFWVIGNWSGNLTLIDRTGAIVQAGPAPTSASDLAYYADPDGVEHVFCFNNGTNDVDDYNIATNTITSAVFNFNSTPGFDSGSSGGCHVATYAGKTAFFGDIQQDPNLIGIYELDGNAPVPPQPVEGVVGAILYRDGEFVGMFDATTTTYQEVLEPGEYTYTIRVIYGGDPDVTYYAMSCGDEVVVEWLSVEEDEVINSIYPNPTSSDLHINATAMRHITVFNAMGQVVYNQDVNSDEMVLNMSQLESGVYMVKVDTENGSSVKRITVVK